MIITTKTRFDFIMFLSMIYVFLYDYGKSFIGEKDLYSRFKDDDMIMKRRSDMMNVQ